MASPNKIKNVGYDYKPFQMKAKNNNNSPINKNYGSPAQRGFDFTGGVGSTEKEGGVGSSLMMTSPAKGWFKKLAKKLNPVNHIKNLAKGIKSGNMKSILSGGVLGAKDKEGGEEGAAAAEGGASGVQPHGDEMHTGGGGDGTAQAAVGGGGMDLSPGAPSAANKSGKMWGGISNNGIGAFGGGNQATLMQNQQEEEVVPLQGGMPYKTKNKKY